MKKNTPVILVSMGLIIVSFIIWQKRLIILHAKKYLGVLEKGDNLGWNDPKFESKLRSVGWYPGAQWCVYFVKAMWNDVYPRFRKITVNGKPIIDYISGNSQTTYKNFLKLASETNYIEVEGVPKAGDIVVWQNYDSSGRGLPTGHVGIVTSVRGDKFKTVEGNTSELGFKEETVSIKEHSLGEYSRKSGLRLKGFIHYKNA